MTARALVVVLTVAACSAEPAEDVAVTISRDGAGDQAPLRVAYGKRWLLGGDIAADASGASRVPAHARIVVAYVDANRNERFDRYAEPSGDCELVSSGWTCKLALQRATVQRAMSHRAGEYGDQTLVFWEDFRGDGSRIESRLCIGDQCTVAEAGPFVSRGDVRLLSLCGEEGFPEQRAVVRDGAAPAIAISHPPALDVSLRTKRDADALRVHVEAPPVDRLLVWAGTLAADGEAKRVYWHSEAANVNVTELSGAIDVHIPSPLVRTCERDPSCQLVIQMLDYGSPSDASIVSATEFRSTVSFRGQP